MPFYGTARAGPAGAPAWTPSGNIGEKGAMSAEAVPLKSAFRWKAFLRKGGISRHLRTSPLQWKRFLSGKGPFFLPLKSAFQWMPNLSGQTARRPALPNQKADVRRGHGLEAPQAGCSSRQMEARREKPMKKIMFVALVVLAGLAVILDDGRPRTRRR